MRQIRLNREEKAIEDALLNGEYTDVAKSEFDQIAEALSLRRGSIFKSKKTEE